MRRRRLGGIFVVVVLVAVAISGWFYLAEEPMFGLLPEDGTAGDSAGGGGSDGAAQGGGEQPTEVDVHVVRADVVPIYLDYTGTTVAVRSVEIRARVSGYLIERNFEEGGEVAAGQVLYRIDPRPFEVELARATAQREAQEAQLAYARAEVARIRPLAAEEFAPQSRLDELIATRERAEATVRELDARIEQARLDLEYATIEAPFAGRIGISRVEVGDLVGEISDELTDLVVLDPIFVRFEPSDRDLSRIRAQLAGAGGPVGQSGPGLPVVVTTADGGEHPQVGTLVQLDNEVDPQTGTIAARAVLPNAGRDLLPGQFLRIKLILDEREAILVPTDSLSTNQGERILYLIGDDGRVEARPVQTGRTYDERTLIESGLSVGERVITSKLQRLRGGVRVVAADAAKAAEAGEVGGGGGGS